METGTVKFFDSRDNKRFGFIRKAGGQEVFFHLNDYIHSLWGNRYDYIWYFIKCRTNYTESLCELDLSRYYRHHSLDTYKIRYPFFINTFSQIR